MEEGIAINKGNHSDIYYNYAAASLDRDIEDVCVGLQPQYSKYLHNVTERNVFIIINYINNMRTEVNLSDNYRKDIIKLLCIFSKFNKNKPFDVVTKTDILTFLNSFRKDEATDQMHGWIGTYNIYRIHLLRFFKWLHFPDIESGKRPMPEVIQNIPSLRRKEKSIYKPTDLWTVEDDLLFLKYCPSKRNKCFHAMAHDTGCRPHELLKLRIKDISFRSAGNRQYAEVFVNGKTGSRHIPLIDSIPYIKDYLDHEHPHPGNPTAILLCGTGKSLGRILNIVSLSKIYNDYKTQIFPKLLLNPNIPPEDKQKISELLKKPWNPYIRRHSSLTEKSKILKEHTLRQFAGWSINSNMPQKYIHYFGNEASESLLEAYGIVTNDKKLSDALRPKQCPNCNEPNKPDGKFCAKCRMVLTYDAYSETLESEKQKEDKLTMMEERFNTMQSQMQTLITALGSMKDQKQIDQTAHLLYKSGVLGDMK
jgi:integrase